MVPAAPAVPATAISEKIILIAFTPAIYMPFLAAIEVTNAVVPHSETPAPPTPTNVPPQRAMHDKYSISNFSVSHYFSTDSRYFLSLLIF